jgi:polygalacturonase
MQVFRSLGMAVVLAASAGSLAAAAEAPASALPGALDVRTFGAKGDGKAVDTDAINKAIAAAHAAGGGTVHFPAGTYLSTSIHLMSHVGLYLEHGATIEAASHSVKAYDAPEPNPWEKYQDFGHTHWHNSLIWGEDVEDVTIAGPGLIHGKGLVRSNNAPQGAGNKAIGLKNSRKVVIRDVSILHGGHFAILATGVDDLTIDNVRIDTNRDGIDVDCCRNVRISNCLVNSPFDDGICLKSSYGLGVARATENVTITNCIVSGYDEGTLLDGTYKRTVHYNGGPTGRIKFGTESNGGFKNVVVSNCVFEYSRGLALEAVDGGAIEDVSISNITMRDIVNAPIFVRLGRRNRGPNPPMSVVRRVNITDIVASNVDPAHGILVAGIPEQPIEDLRLSNIRIAYQGGGTKADAAIVPGENEEDYPEPMRFGTIPAYGLFARHVKGLEVHHVDLSYAKDEARPAVVLSSVAGADLEHVKAQHASTTPSLVLRDVTDFALHDSPGLPETRREKVAEEAF